MRLRKLRLMALTTLASGMLLATSCTVADAILETIRLALGIADVWA